MLSNWSLPQAITSLGGARRVALLNVPPDRAGFHVLTIPTQLPKR
jgi:hypothetical protein